MSRGRKCFCGLLVAVRTSWTHKNLGRRFKAYKFYKFGTRHTGCNYFEWVDEEILDWQRDVTNVLIAEKHRLATDLRLVQAKLECTENLKRSLSQQLDNIEKKKWKQNEFIARQQNEQISVVVAACIVVSVVVSVVVVKLIG
ncbi:uncharacterized protein At4g04775-like [Chenopodium quinoa]|uniref:uncharacterized protein At4g04775-like n=1 Tax=Chenopodium quinoa TaxID=63459 RepID=UPI000B77D356|nr:uncharacterized protein At4g04775-like [Chenopodium quinoa]